MTTVDQIEEIGHGIGDAHAIDISPESDLLSDDDEAESEAESESFETGEMTPEIGSEGAARTLLTYTRDTEVMTTETELLGDLVLELMMFVHPTIILVV
jgi:hypothetical protein